MRIDSTEQFQAMEQQNNQTEGHQESLSANIWQEMQQNLGGSVNKLFEALKDVSSILPGLELGMSRPGDEVALNPQPLPPKEMESFDDIFNPGRYVELNPQPLPPKELEFLADMLNPGRYVELNPQPLPPKDLYESAKIPNPGGPVELNPQPLPPKEAYFRRIPNPPDPQPDENVQLESLNLQNVMQKQSQMLQMLSRVSRDQESVAQQIMRHIG